MRFPHTPDGSRVSVGRAGTAGWYDGGVFGVLFEVAGHGWSMEQVYLKSYTYQGSLEFLAGALQD